MNAHGSSSLAGQEYAHLFILALAIQLTDHVYSPANGVAALKDLEDTSYPPFVVCLKIDETCGRMAIQE